MNNAATEYEDQLTAERLSHYNQRIYLLRADLGELQNYIKLRVPQIVRGCQSLDGVLRADDLAACSTDGRRLLAELKTLSRSLEKLSG